MASAYINNVRISPENFLDCLPAYPSHGWISPRASFGNDFAGNGEKNDDGEPEQGNVKDLEDFEFQIDDPVTMLPADELFSNGKLLPLHMAPIPPMEKALVEIRSPEPICSRRKVVNGENEVWSSLPKAPRCSSRLKELLRLRKVQSSRTEHLMDCPAPFKSSSSKSLKNLLHRNPRSPSKSYSSSCLPLLGDFDSDSAASSAGTSLSSSSSSSADHEDLPRLSLDSGRINSNSTFLCRNPPRARSANGRPLATRRQPSDLISGCSIAVRPIRPAPESVAEGYMAMKSAQGLLPRATGEDDDLAPLRCSAVDSPRLNASGKVIFQGIGRSSSSPSICNGFRRPRPRGMERSYSANVLVTPVLNVPVCTVRGTAKPVYAFGFGQLFSQQKKEKDGASPVKSLTCQTNGVAKRT